MTTENPNPRQDAFDRVCDHLAQQKRRAYGPSPGSSYSGCRYSMEDGRCCAVGALMTPEDRHNHRDSQLSAYQLHPGVVTRMGLDPREDRVFLNRLQTIHDVCTCVESLRRDLRCFADAYGLDPARVDKIQEWS